ncbi:hypothetical protein CYY_001990 [Polysphondylium violaceum]|uniref:GrpE protein homolog n=1 Tax=Polysphondylium violaceum TaxID=133409 RepID=A0A8J4PYW2_9MYCE|nr:hypothetical protein CYY_001990 [Polysphondylium violaceum]
MNTIIRRTFSRAVNAQSFSLQSTKYINSSRLLNNRYYSTESNNTETKAEEKKDLTPEQEELAKLKEELEETKKQVLYIAADRENVRRFAKEDADKAKKFGIQSFAKELLEVVDQMEMALGSCTPEMLQSNKQLQDLHEGIKMTENLFLKIMGNNGLTRSNPLGEKFDFNEHHAIYEIQDPSKENGTIGNVVKQGYKLNNRLVRPAMVGVVKNK